MFLQEHYYEVYDMKQELAPIVDGDHRIVPVTGETIVVRMDGKQGNVSRDRIDIALTAVQERTRWMFENRMRDTRVGWG